jgi:uncharacterized iron-regulated membrane protein
MRRGNVPAMPLLRRPALARLHAWTGVTLALPLLLLVISGSAMLFKDALFVPAGWRVPAAAPRAAADPDAEIARLIALPGLQAVDAVQLARGGRDFHVVEAPGAAPTYWRTGASVAATDAPWRLRAEHLVLELHAHLLGGAPGEIAVRVLAVFAVAVVVVGLVMWWPMRRGWRARDLLARSSARPQLLRAHLAIGGAAGVLVLAHVTSGLLLAFNPPVRAWLKPFADPRATQAPQGVSLDFAAGDPVAAMAALRRVFPQGPVTQLAPLPAAGGTQWSLKLRLPGEDHPNGRSNVTLDVAAGRLVATRDARLAGAPAAYDDVLYPLHIGRLFGDAQRLLWLLGGIVIFRLVTAGVTAFLRRPARGSSRRPAPV